MKVSGGRTSATPAAVYYTGYRQGNDVTKRAATARKSTASKGAREGAQATTTAAARARQTPAARGRGGRRPAGTAYTTGAAKGKHLVIVESPSKARTINKYLGSEYLVLASVGHVRDLPSKNPKGVKNPVPGVDLEHNFRPTYEILSGKDRVVSDLKRAAKEAQSTGGNVWFATDLDREGEAIAWHLAQELGISSREARRVIFPAITRSDIEHAFGHPHPIDEDRVNAQQARRIVDRIVGYQVSPLLWKKVARGLSAGRVQSVAVRLIVEREREIRAFIPEEYWAVTGSFALSEAEAGKLGPAWEEFLASVDARGNTPTIKQQNAWLSSHKAFKAELIEVDGEKFDLRSGPVSREGADAPDLLPEISRIADLAGLTGIETSIRQDDKAKGPARFIRTVSGRTDPSTPYRVVSIETKRTTSRPAPPFITSTMQQSAATRLGFAAQRTMRAAQQLYEGVDIPGEGPVGLITYMRTDSTHLSGDALKMARHYIGRVYGDKYLPEKPNFFASGKAAQEAHEAIRPTSLDYPPQRVRNSLKPDQLKLYTLIWERFLACQMTPAQWDSTTVLIEGGKDADRPLTFKATGRVLVFDGFYKVAGVPTASDEQTLPTVAERQALNPLAIDAAQKFTSPPARYSEASLIKTLEQEGIGRPSTYAQIIQTIQDRKYVEQLERRFFATDLGEVVTDKLVEAFPHIMDVGYTREMETQLDKIEDDHLDWLQMLKRFYGPFKEDLEHALENLAHAKAEVTPAPDEFKCAECGAGLVYRFGKSGRFLSCSRYPECHYASPVDREGRPRAAAETVDVACPKCGNAMTRRTGRFGPFLGCARYNDKKDPCDGILNIDKKGHVTAPSQPPLVTDLPCPTCQSPLNLRSGLRGPWLGCSRFPKCRGRGKWADVPVEKRAELEQQLAEHERANPVPIIRTMSGRPLTDEKGKPRADAPSVDQLAGGETSEEGGKRDIRADEPEEVVEEVA
jgi:DNA topoisomerase I